jgi:predicted acetyltransferase
MKKRNTVARASTATKATPSLRLVSPSEPAPADLAEVLLELGVGDSRFRGTSFGQGRGTLENFLQECRDGEDPAKVPPEFVPQSIYWVINDAGKVIAIVRVRHRLNERLLQYGGHVGYYVRPSKRGKGYGKEALRLALEPLRQLKVPRALLTVNPANTHSIRVVLANGGVEDSQGVDPISKEVVNRYWIAL